MTNSAKLDLPYIAAAQAQKHVTHNEALTVLDAVVQISVGDSDRNEPPSDPLEGQRHLVGPSPTGAFQGWAGRLAAFQDGAWRSYTPRAGWLVHDESEQALRVFDGVEWRPAFDATATDRLGINAAADDVNRLTIASDAVLFNHDGKGHQIKVNKATAGDTGSLLFQTGFSGRAEMGLAGDDDFAIKVSADGSAFVTAMTVDRGTGSVTFPNTAFAAGSGDGGIQYREENGFGADPNFSFDADNIRLSVGTGNKIGVVTTKAQGGEPSIYLYGSSPYLQLQSGAIWQGLPNGGMQFRTGNDGIMYFGVKPGGANLTAIGIREDGKVRIGAALPSTQSQLQVDGPVMIGTYTVATLPSAQLTGAGAIVYVSDESDGATPAFSDGTQWRRLSDRALVS